MKVFKKNKIKNLPCQISNSIYIKNYYFRFYKYKHYKKSILYKKAVLEVNIYIIKNKET